MVSTWGRPVNGLYLGKGFDLCVYLGKACDWSLPGEGL